VLTSAESPIQPETGPDVPSDRRFYPRVSPAGVTSVSFGDRNLGRLLNLSENGLLVSTPLALVENFVCRIRLLLSGLANPIQVYVRVVWTSESQRSGIQLLDLCDRDREQLRQWAATQEPYHSEPQPAPTDPAAPARTSDTKTIGPQTPTPKPPFSKLPLLASIPAALLMLLVALMVRGTSLRSLLSPSTHWDTKSDLAMRPGGAVSDKPPDPQAPVLTSSPPSATEPQSAPANDASLSVSAPQANSSASTPPRAAEHPQNPSSPQPQPNASFAKTAPRTTNPAKTGQPALPVRNRSVLEAKKHFGDQFIGHLDLAGSANNDSQPTLPQTAPPTAADAHSSANKPQPETPAPIVSTNEKSAVAPQHSAIAGSITNGSSATAEKPALDSDRVPSDFATEKTAPEDAAPQPSTSASSVPAASNPPSTKAPPVDPPPANRGIANAPAPTATSPTPRTLQVTLPNNPRASYINLPGEQILQSGTITLHVQRAILAPPASTPAGSRTETVVVGNVVSHVEPRTPPLTHETGTRVGVRAFLGTDGRVEKLMPVNGSVALVSSAVRAVRQWQFQPTLLEGKPVQMAIYVLVEFHPETPNGSAQP